MYFLVIRRPKAWVLAVTALAALLLAAAAFHLYLWLTAPYPPFRIGMEGLSPALISELVALGQIGGVKLAAKPELLSQLAGGELDYVLELDKATPGLVSMFVGKLVPAIVVPFFASVTEINLAELQRLIAAEPDAVHVSDILALPGFPWWESPVHYCSSTEVKQNLRTGQAKIGIIPLQDRAPSVRVLPLAEGEDLLTRQLFLSRLEKSWPESWKSRLVGGEEPQLNYQAPEERQFTFLAAGDIMLNRDVEKVGLQKGWEYIFEEVAPLIRQADLAFANLESPIGDKGHFINMFQAPPEAVEGLAYAGFDLVSLANNHTLDYHHAGMFETMRLLAEYGIDWVGAGKDINEARAPLIKEVNGVRAGFLAYTEMWFVHAREPISWQGTEDEPGVAPAELELITEDIALLRDLADCVIVTFHWGKEYTHELTAEQKRLARAAIAAGADLVLGHHPHVLQGIEFYKEGVIAYSLGNFVFDLNLPKTWETMVLEFTVSSKGVLDMKVMPAYIFGVQPRILEGRHRDSVYSHIRNLSLQID